MKREEEEILGEQRRIEKQKKNSDVYKLIHNMESAPARRVDMLTPVVAEADYREAEFKNGAFVVDTVLPSSVVLDMVSRSSGKRAQQGAALAADGSVDGLPPGKHGLHLREAGDLSQCWNSNIEIAKREK
ncbi:hypothetical protein MSG28_016194 [Choristoneura fumiferana]|uniref:Uncharacterized protein n=1 Tax=Choristoneura fumiferana TaxID=7141 RepID=A0ACC0K5M0_CHOFU|nr:hypothetical protein MSG28_016194 [Choristoneura fumiferana]